MSARSRSVVALAAVALSLLWAAGAAADGSVEIGRVRGPRGRAVERLLTEALEARGVEVAAGAGVRITARVRRQGRRRRRRFALDVAIHAAGRVEHVRVARRSFSSLVEAAADAILPHVAAPRREPPAPDEGVADRPVRAREPAAVRTPRSDARPAGPERHAPRYGEAALELAVGVDWMARHLSFTDDLFDRVGGYRLDAAPVARVSLRWFPLRHWMAGVVSGVGLEAEARGAFGVTSTPPEGGATYPTVIDEWRLGALFDARAHELVRLEGGVSYGEARFRIDPLGPTNMSTGPHPVPSVRYRYLRTAAAVDLDVVEWLSVGGGVGWRAVLASGELAYPEWFPRSFTTGVDLGLHVTVRLARFFAVRARVRHVRYISALNPEPGDVRVAGGALDEWTSAGVDASFTLPGAP